MPPLHPLTLQLFDTIAEFEKRAKANNPGFRSPIWEGAQKQNPSKSGKPLRLKEWGKYSAKQQSSKQHNSSANKKSGKGPRQDRRATQTTQMQLNACGAYMSPNDANTGSKPSDLELLEHLYEAARLVVASNQAGLELSMMYLEMAGVLRGGGMGDLAHAWDDVKGSFTRAAKLKEVCCHAPLDVCYCLHVLA